MIELTYFERRGFKRDGDAYIGLYELKSEYIKTLMPSGEPRWLYIVVLPDERLRVNQPDNPANPTIPSAALLELPRLLEDWRAENERRKQALR